MPLLSEILTDIDTIYPNTFTAAQKAYWINRTLVKYYKYAPKEMETLIMFTSGISDYLASSSDGFRFENFESIKVFDTKDEDSTASTATATTNVNSTTILAMRASYSFLNASTDKMWFMGTTVILTTDKNGTTVPTSGTAYFLSNATNLQTFSTITGGAGFEVTEIHFPISSSDREEFEIRDKSGLNESRADIHVYESSDALGIFPTPTTSGQLAIVRYNKYPATLASTDSTFIPDMREDYHEIIINSVINKIAKAGINPDIDIANNAQAELDELLRMARLEVARKKTKARGRNRVSYKEGWEVGSDIGLGSSS